MIFRYKGYNNFESMCDIQRNGNVIIATEIEENQGTSITNMVEQLALELCEMYKIKHEDLIWIELYNSGSYKKNMIDKERYSLVKFEIVSPCFKNPKWEPIDKVNALELFNKGYK